jgi:hypothetical protein
MHCHPRSLILQCLAVSLASFLLAPQGAVVLASHKDSVPDESHKGPKVVLSVSPAVGFSPLSVELVAILSGVDAHDPNYCHASITWIRVDPGSRPETGSRVTESPRCLHGDDEISVATSFSKTFDLYTPGAYLYRLVIDGKDGTELRSNFVKVQVMRIP